MCATRPEENVAIIPEGSQFMISVAYSPESRPGVNPWIPFCLCRDNPSDAALDTVSQYMILPVDGMITRRPGCSPVAVDSKTPSGAVPFGSLLDSGIDILNVSEGNGAEVGTEYGHTMACECVKASA